MTVENSSYNLQSSSSPKIDILTLITHMGQKIDLTPLLVNLNLYEDIFSPSLTGDVTIYDTNNILNLVPLTGNETLTVKFSSYNYASTDPIQYIHKTFNIILITDISEVNDYTKTYVLHFISPEFIRNEQTHISKGYINSTISSVVERLMTDDYDIENPSGLGFPKQRFNGERRLNFSPFMLSDSIETWNQYIDDNNAVELFIEKTKYVEPVISFPYMRPFDIITWLSSKSLRHAIGRNGTRYDNQSASFLFFENVRGFQFVSLETLLERKELSTTVFKKGNAEQNKTDKEFRKIYHETIEELQIQDCYDIIDNIRNGMYASRLYTFDMITGEIEEYDYSYVDQFYNTESTERTMEKEKDYPMINLDNPILSERPLSKRLMVASQKYINNITSEKSQRDSPFKRYSGQEEYLQQRLSQLARLNNYRVLFKIQGNSKHKVGDMVTIEMNDIVSDDNMKNDKIIYEQENKYYTGYYLITSIKHTLTKFEYKMNVEAVKDSYKKPIRETIKG